MAIQALPTGAGRIDTAALKLAHPVEHVVTRYGIKLKRQGRSLVGGVRFTPTAGDRICMSSRRPPAGIASGVASEAMW